MSKKSAKIAALVAGCSGGEFDPRYVGYFECFNRELYYEAHDVLEELWLLDRNSPDYAYYKGLIQLAGAFVHLQKERLRPSAALFKLARANLLQYPPVRHRLNVAGTLTLIEDWLSALEGKNFSENPLRLRPSPKLSIHF